MGRRNALGNFACNAANAIVASHLNGAISLLDSLLARIDDGASPSDWMHTSIEKSELVDDVNLLIELLLLEL